MHIFFLQFFRKVRIKYEQFYHVAFHSTFIHASGVQKYISVWLIIILKEIYPCIHLENYAESMFNIYFLFKKPSSHLTIMI